MKGSPVLQFLNVRIHGTRNKARCLSSHSSFTDFNMARIAYSIATQSSKFHVLQHKVGSEALPCLALQALRFESTPRLSASCFCKGQA